MKTTPPRPFSSYQNPIGNAPPSEVVVITFQALEAWAREQGLHRSGDETPAEFVRRLSGPFPQLRESAVRVVDAYNRVVFGKTDANQRDVQAADSLWQNLRPQLIETNSSEQR